MGEQAMDRKSWTDKWFAKVAALMPMKACVVGPVVSSSPTFPPNAQVDAIFAQWDKPDSPGFALAVSQAGNVVYARGYGMADLDHGIAITPSTVFHACSLAKQFTAMSILLLAPQLKLTDEVHTFIPQLKGVIPPITVGQLLHHISGIRDQWVLATLAGWILSDDMISEKDVVEDLVPRMKTLNFSPGSDYSYSNTNYTLAGAIVRQVSGLSLAEFAGQHIFGPLGMTSTTITETHGQIVKNRAYGYYSTSSGFKMRMPNYDLTGPTNLLTTVEDLMRWDHNFDLLTVGGAANLAAMQTTVPHSGDYGLGLFIRTDQGRRIVEHDGRDPGHRSHLIRYPDQKLAVALLGNVQLPNSIYTGDLVRNVAAVYLNSAPAAAPPSSAQPTPPVFTPASLTDYPGRYYSDEVDNVCEVILDGSSIVMAHRKYDPATLTAVSTDTFTMNNFSVVLSLATVQFSRDAQGKIDGFYIDDTSGADRLRHFRFAKMP
jgi:CubicO group peptidase (beta-lactamase class C family)